MRDCRGTSRSGVLAEPREHIAHSSAFAHRSFAGGTEPCATRWGGRPTGSMAWRTCSTPTSSAGWGSRSERPPTSSLIRSCLRPRGRPTSWRRSRSNSRRAGTRRRRTPMPFGELLEQFRIEDDPGRTPTRGSGARPHLLPRPWILEAPRMRGLGRGRTQDAREPFGRGPSGCGRRDPSQLTGRPPGPKTSNRREPPWTRRRTKDGERAERPETPAALAANRRLASLKVEMGQRGKSHDQAEGFAEPGSHAPRRAFSPLSSPPRRGAAAGPDLVLTLKLGRDDILLDPIPAQGVAELGLVIVLSKMARTSEELLRVVRI
jgi:hypothetical protein